MNQKNIWDVVVIGGGPAGMMAAGKAAQNGRSVLLLEKNSSLGKKLLITGGGRCNVTNNKTNVREMLSKYKKNDQFLFSAFSQFNVKDTLTFFNSRGMATKEENEGRIFPISNSARTVWDVLVQYIDQEGVHVQSGVTVTGLSVDPKTKNIIIKMGAKRKIITRSCVLATGGTSHPETGSTGEGFLWLKQLGHTIIENNFMLVPISLSDKWPKKLGGVVLKDVKLTAFQNNQKQISAKGDLLFTHFGISGPMVLNMSKEIGELLKYGDVLIALDLFPKVSIGALRGQLQDILVEESNKKIKNTLKKLVPAALVLPLLEIVKIDIDVVNHSVSSLARKEIVNLMKSIPLNVDDILGANKAIVSSGGVALEEVSFKTMQSRLVPNLYLVGDVLNIDRPSGGYSLQLCWTTGFVAGNSIST